MTVTIPKNSYTTVFVGGGGSGGTMAGSCPGYGAVPGQGAVGSVTSAINQVSITNTGNNYASSGKILNASTGWVSASNITMSTSILSIQAEDGGDAYIKTNKNKINLDDMAETMSVIKERLLILTPNFELHEKYPVLKDLYEQYKVVEAMLQEDEKK